MRHFVVFGMETSGEPYDDSNSSWGSDSDDDDGCVRGSDGERDDIGLSDVQYHDGGACGL